jgi:uncharacterized membrane protein
VVFCWGVAGSFARSATRSGGTSIVAVISSLFSAVTAPLAWIFLRERLSHWQWVGILTTFLDIALVSLQLATV